MKTIVRGDTVPLRFVLERKNDTGDAWIVPNFSGALVRMIVRADDAVSTALLDRAGVFESVPDGIVSIPRQAGDFSGTGEQCALAEFEVTYADGTIETFPRSAGKLPLLIVDDLG